MNCVYCDPEKQRPFTFNRNRMCPRCREEYDCHLEEKADAERDERAIREKEDDFRGVYHDDY